MFGHRNWWVRGREARGSRILDRGSILGNIDDIIFQKSLLMIMLLNYYGVIIKSSQFYLDTLPPQLQN